MQPSEKKAESRRETILDKCNALSVAGLWPQHKIRPGAWLSNFKTPEEVLIACALLDNFVCISDRAADSMIRSAYGRMLQRVKIAHPDYSSLSIQEIEDLVYFAAVPGEESNPGDSGNALCRKVRQAIRIDKNRFVSLERARDEYQKGSTIVFIDDFLCSGNQLRRMVTNSPDLCTPRPGGVHAFYLLAHTSGTAAIASLLPHLQLHYCHQISEKDSFRRIATPPPGKDAEFSEEMVASFLVRHAEHLRPPDGYLHDYADNTDLAFGYAQLGLLVALEDFVPDSTLPLFWSPSELADWNVLMERL